MSIQTAAQSITKFSAVAVSPRRKGAAAGDPRPPPTCPSRRAPPFAPAGRGQASRRASSTSGGVRKRRRAGARSTIMSGPPTNLAERELPAHQERKDDPELDHQVVEANWKAIAAVKLAPLRKSERASPRRRRSRTRRPCRGRWRSRASAASRRAVAAASRALRPPPATAPESVKPRISAQRIPRTCRSRSSGRPRVRRRGQSTRLAPPVLEASRARAQRCPAPCAEDQSLRRRPAARREVVPSLRVHARPLNPSRRLKPTPRDPAPAPRDVKCPLGDDRTVRLALVATSYRVDAHLTTETSRARPWQPPRGGSGIMAGHRPTIPIRAHELGGPGIEGSRF